MEQSKRSLYKFEKSFGETSSSHFGTLLNSITETVTKSDIADVSSQTSGANYSLPYDILSKSINKKLTSLNTADVNSV